MGLITGTLGGIGSAAQYSLDHNVNIFSGKPNPVMEKPVTLEPLPIPKVGVTVSKSEISGEDFVHVTTPSGAIAIQSEGLDPSISGFVTKYKYVENVTNGSDFETMLYKQSEWSKPNIQGKFAGGFEILKIDARPSFYSPRTNWINGIPQWRFSQPVLPNNIFKITK